MPIMQKSWKAAAKAANRNTLVNKLFDLGTILKHMNFPSSKSVLASPTILVSAWLRQAKKRNRQARK
jgi:hypothetical protein